MNKKKIIIIVGMVLCVLLIGIGSMYLIKTQKENNRIYSTITIDVNPSMKINLNKKDKVISVEALNSDANIIDEKELKGKGIDKAIDVVVDKLKDNGYLKEEKNTILINVESENKKLKSIVESEVKKVVEEKVEVVVQSIEVTEEIKKVAEENNISESKVAYVLEQIKDVEGIEIKEVIDKNIEEVKEVVEEKKEEIKKEEEKKEAEEKAKKEAEEKAKQQSTKQQSTKQQSGSSSSTGKVGSLSQCQYVKENLTKEEVKQKVIAATNTWQVNTIDSYAYLYNGTCTFRCDLVVDNVEHSFMYNITTKELAGHLTKKCNACTLEQMDAKVKAYMSSKYNATPDQYKLNTASLGGFGDTRSDYVITYEGKTYTFLFDRYNGNILSVK